MSNFWSKLNKPIYALAPMAGYTDSAFRQICKKFGADVVYSELASVEALIHDPKKTLAMLKFDKSERPYVVQLFGSSPEHFARAVKIIEKKIKPDGLDINFGCAVKKVQKQRAGAVLMDDLKLSKQIIKTVIENTDLPVSLKIRSQAKNINALEFLENLSGLDIKAVMIHGRTLAQGHSGPVDWQMIKQARKFFKGIILANGRGALTPSPSPAHFSQERGTNLDNVRRLLDLTGADGVGIARGALGRPWIFRELRIMNDELRIENAEIKSREEIFKVILNHAKLEHKLKGDRGILEMRKHLCWYVAGLPEAKKLREKLVKVKTLEEIKRILM